jgi:hypothetical protein
MYSCAKSKSDTSHTSDDDDEAYAISDGQLLSHIVGEVSEVGLDDALLSSVYEVRAKYRKSRTFSFKKNAWPNKKARVSKSSYVSK